MSFLSRFKSTAGPSSPASAPVKKDPHAPQPTPLEKLLADAGPLRDDGSDKFFGFENFGSTCYCNSIIQCLYYSVPFREQVINFPTRSPQQSLIRPASQLPRLLPDAQNGPASPAKPGLGLASPTVGGAAAKKPPPTPGSTNPGAPKPEENKDSPEYKKKLALATGPVINMDYENSSSYGMSESLFTCLKDIFEAIIVHKSRIGVVSPNKFLEILRRDNEMFRTAMHQDAHEFLNIVLNEVVENVEQFSRQALSETSGTPDLSTSVSSLASGTASNSLSRYSPTSTGWVHELFEGTLTSETRCLTCENTSQRDEAFLDLSVDLEEHSSVTSCLRKFSEEEMLCERNKFHCDNCGGLQEAEKRMKIKRLPRVLALHLKRFKYTEDLQRLQKLFHRVVYPYHLRLFNTTEDAEDPDRLYELYAVVVHIGGGPYHGHYVSIVKTQDKGWLLFDDELVEPVDKNYVRNFFGGEGNLACAYVLFYQETTLEAMEREQEAEDLAAERKAAAANPTDSATAGSKPVNGTNGHIPVPVGDDLEMANMLDHAATAPQLSPGVHPPLKPTLTSQVLPPLTPKKSNLQSKKAKAQEEKDRKAAEKEQEKLAKLRRKEMEHARRDSYRRQEEELKAAIAASKASAKADDVRRTSKPEDNPTGSENGQPKNGSLSRFRQSSMSLRHKSTKLWSSSKEKQDDSATGAAAAATAATTTTPTSSSTGDSLEKEKERGKNRFSIGRKKSNLH